MVQPTGIRAASRRDEISKEFEIQSEVRRGFIFPLVIGNVLRTAFVGEHKGIGWTVSSFLEYLDHTDICLLVCLPSRSPWPNGSGYGGVKQG